MLALAAVAIAAIISVTYVADLKKTGTLPPGCSQPAGGFLIIASTTGFNDSTSHVAPNTFWPIITVKHGSTVNITVCNTAPYAHGFQIGHYYNSSIVTIAPGQVIRVSFVADEPGTFQIYCSIFCPTHYAMLNGRLIVTP